MVEKPRVNRRWTLAVAPLGMAIVFLSVLITVEAHDQAYTVALGAFSVAIPLLSLIAFLTSLQVETTLPRWWEAIASKMLVAGYALVAIGVGALLSRINGWLMQGFAVACLAALVLAAVALKKRPA